MPINPLIPMRTNVYNAGPALSKITDAIRYRQQRNRQQQQDREQREYRDRRMDLEERRTESQLMQQRFEMQGARQKRRLRNNVLDAVRLQGALDSGGKDAAMEFLRGNRERNDSQGWDSEETNQAMQMLESGNIEGLRGEIQRHMKIGEAVGIIQPGERREQWETLTDDQGNPIAQRNVQTGKVTSDPRAPSGDGAKAWEGMSASDTNAIHRQAASLYGGMFDPETGEFQGLDKDSAQNAVAIAERASQIYAQNRGRIGHSEALAQAARQSGIEVRDVNNETQTREAADRYMEQRYGPTRAGAPASGGSSPEVIRYDAQGNRIE